MPAETAATASSSFIQSLAQHILLPCSCKSTVGANQAFPYSEGFNMLCTEEELMAFGEILLEVQEGLLSTKKHPF